jgi:hypothetical protein
MPEPSVAANTAVLKSRLLYLDLFRGLAILFMFDAHLTDALVKLGPGAGRIHQWHSLAFNLPAPAFLFAAGLSFGMTVYSRWDQLHAGFGAIRGRLARIMEVLFIAYLLHAPATSLSATLAAPQSAMRRFLGWDILQCIGYSLLLLLAVAIVSSRREWFLASAGVITLIISLVSAWFWDISWDTGSAPVDLPWVIATMFSKQLGSNFPFFPYAVFLTAGALCGYLLGQAHASGGDHKLMNRSFWVGISMIIASLLVAPISLPAPYDDFWGGSPVFIYLRLGLLTVILAVVYFFQATLAPALNFLIILGRESLMVYFVHLIILYGSPITPAWSLRRFFSEGISFWMWLGLLAVITATMTVLARYWMEIKTRGGKKVDRALWLAAALAIIIFVSR